MFVKEPEERCPYAEECSGYVGGFICINGHHIKCDRFKLLRDTDECYEQMNKILRGLNNGK